MSMSSIDIYHQLFHSCVINTVTAVASLVIGIDLLVIVNIALKKTEKQDLKHKD